MANLINIAIDINSSGSNVIISAAGTTTHIRIHRLVLINSVATAQQVTLFDGATALTGVMGLPSSIGGGFILADLPGGAPWFRLSANSAFNITLGAGSAVAGFVQYTVG